MAPLHVAHAVKQPPGTLISSAPEPLPAPPSEPSTSSPVPPPTCLLFSLESGSPVTYALYPGWALTVISSTSDAIPHPLTS